MDLGAAVKSCFNKYVTFSGRSPRSEYWFWILFVLIGSIVIGLFDPTAGVNPSTGMRQSGTLSTIFSLIIFLPGISVAVRRMHDLGRSGWWTLISLIPVVGWILFIVWAATKGTNGDNRFGPDPLAPQMIG